MSNLAAAWAGSAKIGGHTEGLTDDQLMAIDPDLAYAVEEAKRKKEKEELIEFEEHRHRIVAQEERRERHVREEILRSGHGESHLQGTIQAAKDFDKTRSNFGGESKTNLDILHAQEDMLNNWSSFSKAMVKSGIWTQEEVAERHIELIKSVDVRQDEYNQRKNGAIDITAQQQKDKNLPLEDPSWVKADKAYNTLKTEHTASLNIKGHGNSDSAIITELSLGLNIQSSNSMDSAKENRYPGQNSKAAQSIVESGYSYFSKAPALSACFISANAPLPISPPKEPVAPPSPLTKMSITSQSDNMSF
jgi:hypothetical protein